MRILVLSISLLVSSIAYSQNNKTALLIIDIQNDYFPNGRFELTNAEQAGKNAGQVLNSFRKAGLPVIHIQHIATKPDAIFFLPNTSGAEIHSSVSPQKGEKIIIKHYPNSFIETDLLETLKKEGITNLVIVGMMTHMCIDATTRAAKDYGFNCTVISDACATRDLAINDVVVNAKDVHNAFLSALNGYYANIVGTATYLKSAFD